MQISNADNAARYIQQLARYLNFCAAFHARIPNIETFASCDEARRNATLREVEQKTGISYQQVCEMIQWDLRAKLEQAAPLIDVSDELFQFLRAAFPGRH